MLFQPKSRVLTPLAIPFICMAHEMEPGVGDPKDIEIVGYDLVGRRRVEDALETPWGRLFEGYGDDMVVMPGMRPRTAAIAAMGLAAAILVGAQVQRRRSGQ
jgi:hypothetical protein